MSVLGAFATTAAVIANEDDVQLRVIDVDFINRLFATEHELFMKFYWNLANKLAMRLAEAPSLAKLGKKLVTH